MRLPVRNSTLLEPRCVARELGGDVYGRAVLAPGPGHSRADRSLSITIDPAAPDGFRCHSFAGDDWREYREHVRFALGLGAWETRFWRLSPPPPDAGQRSASALRIWN